MSQVVMVRLTDVEASIGVSFSPELSWAGFIREHNELYKLLENFVQNAMAKGLEREVYVLKFFDDILKQFSEAEMRVLSFNKELLIISCRPKGRFILSGGNRYFHIIVSPVELVSFRGI